MLLVLLLAGAGVGAYYAWFRPERRPEPNMEAATAANLRGVGLMDQFKFWEAEKEFAEAVRIAPDWLPARINLGIAKLNQHPAEKTLAQHTEEAKELFRVVLKRDPDNPHAHYCLGLLTDYVGERAEAHEHFAAVNRVDPNDPHTWLRVGATHPAGGDSAAARDYYEKALKLDPYLREAQYRLAMVVGTDPARQKALLEEIEALRKAERGTESGIRYPEMGKYANVIARDPKSAGKPVIGPLPTFEPLAGFKVTLAAGAKWAAATDLDAARRAARARFGGAVVLFDYNGDDRPDVFLASAVVQDGKVRDLLLRNDGNGAFTDVTAEAGLATPRPSLGAAAGDFDNDGKPDLVVTGVGEQHLFRNVDGKKFEDVSAAAKLDQVKGVCLGCGWVDANEDAALDLVLCKYAEGDAGAFDGPSPGGEVVLFENVGILPAGKKDDPLPLSTAFRRSDKLAGLIPAGSYVNFLATDLDADRDIDLLVFPESGDPVVIENDRLMRFKRPAPEWLAKQAHKWNGGLVLDANHDERSDLFLVRSGAAPVYLLSKGPRAFEAGTIDSPALTQAVAADIDMDGWTDVVGLDSDGRPVLLHNLGDGRLGTVPHAFGVLNGAHALAVADLDGDGAPDLLLWTDTGLQLHRNRGNGNAAVLIAPVGRRNVWGERTNNDGIGAWITAQSGKHWAGAERTTLSVGLGQSLLPVALGLGKRDRAQLVRVRWPDGVLQSEFDLPTGSVQQLIESKRVSW